MKLRSDIEQLVTRINGFCENECFSHPNPIIQCSKKFGRKIFDAFPETKVTIEEFASANLINPNSKRMTQHICNHIIPDIHAIHIADAEKTITEPWSRDELMRSFNLINIGV